MFNFVHTEYSIYTKRVNCKSLSQYEVIKLERVREWIHSHRSRRRVWLL